jgi:hypothetical protein
MMLMLDDLSFEFSFVAWRSGLGLCRLARKEEEGKELVCFAACTPVFGFCVLHQRGGGKAGGAMITFLSIYFLVRLH